MASTVTLKLGGKPFELQRVTGTEKNLLNFLGKQKEDEIFTIGDVAKHIGVAPGTVGSKVDFENILATYTAKVNNRRYFGHPKAIAELRKQVEA